jgi:ABC-2 type transport system ATP-binding protein
MGTGTGKSTTMRMIMGLDRHDAGRVRIGRNRYGDLRWPLREVGALLEAKAFHPGRTARAHLTALAASNAIGQERVEEVLALTGLESEPGCQGRTVLISSHLISEIAQTADALIVIGQGRLPPPLVATVSAPSPGWSGTSSARSAPPGGSWPSSWSA